MWCCYIAFLCCVFRFLWLVGGVRAGLFCIGISGQWDIITGTMTIESDYSFCQFFLASISRGLRLSTAMHLLQCSRHLLPRCSRCGPDWAESSSSSCLQCSSTVPVVMNSRLSAAPQRIQQLPNPGASWCQGSIVLNALCQMLSYRTSPTYSSPPLARVRFNMDPAPAFSFVLRLLSGYFSCFSGLP